MTRAVISTGQVTVHSEDHRPGPRRGDPPGRGVGGIVADEQTSSDAHGRPRVDADAAGADGEFDEAMTRLADLGTVEQQSRKSEDVTTKVIDNDARVRAAERSIRQIEALLGRAEKLSDIIAIESDLARRQADLDSLKAQQAYLADQTSLSHDHVYLSLPSTVGTRRRPRRTASWPGSTSGWTALGSATVVGPHRGGRAAPVRACCCWSSAYRSGSSYAAGSVRGSRQRAGVLLHEVREPGQLVGVGRRDHAVAEVEDVAGRGGTGLEDLAGPLEHHLGRREDQRRVEVALHGAAADPLDARGERHPPVDADDVGAGLTHQVEDLAGADAEVDARHAGRADPLEHPRRVRHARTRA